MEWHFYAEGSTPEVLIAQTLSGFREGLEFAMLKSATKTDPLLEAFTPEKSNFSVSTGHSISR